MKNWICTLCELDENLNKKENTVNFKVIWAISYENLFNELFSYLMSYNNTVCWEIIEIQEIEMELK